MPLDRATHSTGPSVCKDMQRESPLPFLLDLASSRHSSLGPSSHASVRPGAFEVGRQALQQSLSVDGRGRQR